VLARQVFGWVLFHLLVIYSQFTDSVNQPLPPVSDPVHLLARLKIFRRTGQSFSRVPSRLCAAANMPPSLYSRPALMQTLWARRWSMYAAFISNSLAFSSVCYTWTETRTSAEHRHPLSYMEEPTSSYSWSTSAAGFSASSKNNRVITVHQNRSRFPP
jgi:hypothetical protein